MKKLFLISIISLFAVMAQAQTLVKIEPRLFENNFVMDTATRMRVIVLSLEVNLVTADQTPVFKLFFSDSLGHPVNSMEIYMKDLINACKKNGIPEEEQAATIQGTIAAVLVGSKAEKLYVLRRLLSGYNVFVKPDEDQD